MPGYSDSSASSGSSAPSGSSASSAPSGSSAFSGFFDSEFLGTPSWLWVIGVIVLLLSVVYLLSRDSSSSSDDCPKPAYQAGYIIASNATPSLSVKSTSQTVNNVTCDDVNGYSGTTITGSCTSTLAGTPYQLDGCSSSDNSSTEGSTIVNTLSTTSPLWVLGGSGQSCEEACVENSLICDTGDWSIGDRGDIPADLKLSAGCPANLETQSEAGVAPPGTENLAPYARAPAPGGDIQDTHCRLYRDDGEIGGGACDQAGNNSFSRFCKCAEGDGIDPEMCPYPPSKLGYVIQAQAQGIPAPPQGEQQAALSIIPDTDVDCSTGWTKDANGIKGRCTSGNPVVLTGCNKDSCDAPTPGSQLGYEITADALPMTVNNTGLSPISAGITCSAGYTLGADGIQAICPSDSANQGQPYTLVGCSQS